MQLVDRLPHKNLMWPDKVLEDVILLRVDARWRNEEALQYGMLGQPAKFVRALQHLVAEHPEDPSYWVQLGRAALEAGELRDGPQGLVRGACGGTRTRSKSATTGARYTAEGANMPRRSPLYRKW